MSETLESILQREYGITGLLTKMGGITANEVFNVGEQYFIKVTSKERVKSKETYTTRVELVERLEQESVKVPQIIKTKSGARFVELDRSYLEVHRYLHETEFYTGYLGQIEAVARNMALFHDITSNLPEDFLIRLRSSKSSFSDRGLEQIRALETTLHKYEDDLGLVAEPLHTFLSRFIPVLKERYQEILAYESDQKLNKGIVHGDLHDQQTLFHKNTKELLALIDWESAQWRTRAYDVAYTLERLSAKPCANAIYDIHYPFSELSFCPDKVKSFLKEYDQTRKFNEIDIVSLVSELLVECVNRDISFLDSIFTAARQKNDDFNFDRYHLYLRIMSIERLEKLQQFIA